MEASSGDQPETSTPRAGRRQPGSRRSVPLRWPGGDGAAGARAPLQEPCSSRRVRTVVALTELRRWELVCFDAVGRARQLTVRTSEDGGAVLAFPPGGTAVIPPGRVGGWVMVVDLALVHGGQP